MSWIEIVTEVSRQHADALSDALIEAGALSVSIEDADFGTDAEQALFGEPGQPAEFAVWARSRVIALTCTDTDQLDLLSNAAAAAGIENAADLSCTLRPVAEQDWVRLTQAQFAPIHIGQRIWIVPSWHNAPDPDGINLHLDPGLAFGTGSHPTTRLCVEWLEKQAPSLPQQSLLDYGCGSGILAMIAKKLGSDRTVGVDIDPQALIAAQHNAAVNQLQISFLLPDQLITQSQSEINRFDFVLANILANPLKILAPQLLAQLQPRGKLLLSGVLARQADEVIAAYAPMIDLVVTAELDDWVALSGQAAERLG